MKQAMLDKGCLEMHAAYQMIKVKGGGDDACMGTPFPAVEKSCMLRPLGGQTVIECV